MGMTHVKMKISNPKNPAKKRDVIFLVDSGAFYTFVNEAPQSKDWGLFFSASLNSSHHCAKALDLLAENQNILKDLGLRSNGKKEFILADGSSIERKYSNAFFEMEGSVGAAPVIFAQKSDENLLGATALESLGLLLNPIKRTLEPVKLRK
jgi:hypothetical protein